MLNRQAVPINLMAVVVAGIIAAVLAVLTTPVHTQTFYNAAVHSCLCHHAVEPLERRRGEPCPARVA
jgi:hypothetical protein